MSGMMGLAVDLGWSFFTQKAAQAAADDAALSAVQRAYKTIVSEETFVAVFSFCSDTSDVVCKPTPVACDAADASLGNLQSGCLYARTPDSLQGATRDAKMFWYKPTSCRRCRIPSRQVRVRRKTWCIG